MDDLRLAATAVVPHVVATTTDRAVATAGGTRQADLRAQVHQRLVDGPAVRAGDEGGGEGPEAVETLGGRVVGWEGARELATEDALDVGVQDRC